TSSRFKLAGSSWGSSAEGASLKTDPRGLSGSAAHGDPSLLEDFSCVSGFSGAGLVTEDFDGPSGSSPHTELEPDADFRCVTGVLDRPSGSSPQTELPVEDDLGLVSDVALTCAGLARPRGSSPHTDPEPLPDGDTFGVLGSKTDPDGLSADRNPCAPPLPVKPPSLTPEASGSPIFASSASGPGRLLCAPICTTSFPEASVDTASRDRPGDQVKKRTQNTGSRHLGKPWANWPQRDCDRAPQCGTRSRPASSRAG